MIAKSAFERPLRKFKLETRWLGETFELLRHQHSRESQLACEMIIIRLHDSWARLCRELVILSAYGHTSTLGGLYIGPGSSNIKSRALVVPVLLSTYKKQQYEPKWEKATDCTDAAKRLNVANLSTIAAALGAINSPADDIRNIRNFYAHRKQGSASRALATGYFPGSSKPLVRQLTSFTLGGNTVLETWINGLVDTAVAAMQ